MSAKSKFISIALSGALTFTLSIQVAQAAPTPNPSPTETPIAPATCSASAQINKPELGKFYAYVVDVNTGHVLLDIRGDETTPSASVLKVLSVSAALTNLASDYTAKTTVLTVPKEPGTIVLQGGGDHTLSNMTKGSYTTYAKPARLETLASQVLMAWENKVKINKIILDSDFFSGESYNAAWLASDRTNGYISKITALQVDSDRRNPDQTSKAYDGVRSTDPILRTGNLFKAALKGLVAKGVQLVIGDTPKSAIELTYVSSQPITTWMSHAIGISDNTETEFIARHAAKAAGLPASFASIQPMVERMLDELGIGHAGLVMKDASGLAQADRVTPKLITELLAKVASGDTAIAPLETYLPVAGGPGSLVGRFTGKNAVARKYVKGKTGFIPGLYSLAGIIDAQDGSRLAYSMFARTADGKSVGWSTRSALDTLATRFFICGAGLGL